MELNEQDDRLRESKREVTKFHKLYVDLKAVHAETNEDLKSERNAVENLRAELSNEKNKLRSARSDFVSCRFILRVDNLIFNANSYIKVGDRG